MHSRTSRALAALVVSVSLLAGCDPDDAVRPATEPSTPASSAEEPSDPASSSASTPQEEPRTSVEVTVTGDVVEPVARAVDVGLGETVELVVTADRPGELHVHASPEQALPFDRGRSTLELTVDRPGRVDVEEHSSGTLVLRLLVQ